MPCSICKKTGHNSRTCPDKITLKLEECIICLETRVKTIKTTCCNKTICYNCYHTLILNTVDCPNCRSYFNNNCPMYNERYLMIKLRNHGAKHEKFVDAIVDLTKIIWTIVKNKELLYQAQRYATFIRKELLEYFVACSMFKINLPAIFYLFITLINVNADSEPIICLDSLKTIRAKDDGFIDEVTKKLGDNMLNDIVKIREQFVLTDSL